MTDAASDTVNVASTGWTVWAIPEGYIPGRSDSDDRALVSHETACILNAGDADAMIEITLYFTDREPAGPYRLTVPARRTQHFRFNDLQDPEPVPRDTPYASVIRSSVPVVVQHTRLDSRPEVHGLLSTVAYAGGV
ncbi:MAG TPA: sensory rhodopsin transducer [Stellaceae bacterium]